MKYTPLSILILSIIYPTRLVGQVPSNDYFPLSLGNSWTYQYYTSDTEEMGPVFVIDSGVATYKIVSQSESKDSTIWQFWGYRDVLHHILSYASGFLMDTSYFVKDSAKFWIVEFHSGDHQLSSLATDWQSPFPLFSSLKDSALFLRYYPTAPQDTFEVIHKRYAGPHLYEVLKVSYQRSIGFTEISFTNPGQIGSSLYTKHVLKSAIITSVRQNNFATTPKKFVLFQNYPDPFNPLTVIPFETPTQSRITIRIFDILGRPIETIFDSMIQAGSHSISWNASARASGVYFCVLQSEGISKSIKLMLLK